MKTNLLLIAIILSGAWYLFQMGNPTPAPTVAAAAPAPRPERLNVRTYYSPLDDPAASASRHSGTRTSLSLGTNAPGQTGLTLGGTASANPGASAPSAPYRPNPVATSGDGSNLNVSARAAEIARKARGE